MPSFLNDHNSPIHFQNAGVVHLNDPSQYEGISNIDIKVNGHVPHPVNSHVSNDSFDGSSSHSTHTSESSSYAPNTSGNDTRTSTMSTTNGHNGAIEGEENWKANGFGHGDAFQKPLSNGAPITISPPDRAAPPRPHMPNGTADRTSGHSFAEPPSIRTSMASVTTNSVQPSPVGMTMHQGQRGDANGANNGNGLNADGGFNFRSSSPANTRSSLDPNVPPPQRFSSPAQMSGNTSLNASTPNLHPANQGLKHRHTLEVPRPGQPRGSRDGQDSAVTSGRFSPTNAGPSGTRRASINLVRRNTRSLHSDFPRDEAFPDEDAMRWAEAYRQKRASKKKKKEEEDDDRVLVGTKVDEKHANWVTAYNMLTGIRVAVSRTNAKLDRPLTDADFDSKSKTTFDITGNELVPSAKYDFKFKDYAPWVFRHLRQLFHLDPADYLMSLTGKYILSELGSPGKSGSFFYFSRDYRFIIKTIHHGEHKFLRKILKEYYQHVTENPNTLLSQFYGLHRVKTPWGRKIHFVVMNNLFPPHRDIHTTFDLKGSTIGRDYREEDLEKNPRATLKDLNWLRRQRHLELGIQKKRLFMEQLQKDVKLMQKLHIMDYSLLIGVHDTRKGNDENLRARNLQVFSPGGAQGSEDPNQVLMRTPSKLENQRRAAQMRQLIKSERPVPMGQSMSGMPDVLEEAAAKSDSLFYSDDGGMRATHEDNMPGEEIYYLGVIDCLTHYGVIKKIEHFWKGLSSDRTQISALPPEQYGDRFLNFMTGITMSPEEAQREAEERQTAEAEAVAEKSNQRVASWNSAGRKSSSNNIPAAPTHEPPAPPGRSGAISPQAEETMRRAEHVAAKAEKHGHTEQGVPERIIKTAGSAGGGIFPSIAAATAPAMMATNSPIANSHDSANQAILPIVEEPSEGSTNGEHDQSANRFGHADRTSNMTAGSDGRPWTPARDGRDRNNGGSGNPVLSNMREPSRAPPTPPKTSGSMVGNGSAFGHGKRLTKPESADSGIGVHEMGGRARSGSQVSKYSDQAGVRGRMSRESLDKALPPLPAVNGPA
ncbi:Phosphatidylinositol-4-phosphate 5-kinase [Diaporthe australafricana]|uniref:Phosphatidylinositol-4-phosphate 5-kinase n=1 Tax=Diaporthe australafricana TaxID=127596 RepID=A0ABR3WE56_9PEZI